MMPLKMVQDGRRVSQGSLIHRRTVAVYTAFNAAAGTDLNLLSL